ncbi:MAG: queuosine precursor transporter [Pseudomonadota bacterium]
MTVAETTERSPIDYALRRERVFLLLSGIFLGTLAMLNILGISRFVDMSFDVAGINVPLVVAIGVLPYPITFLCTDLMSELFGRKRANDVVWAGLMLNAWVIFILWLGGVLPGFESTDPQTGQLVRDAAGREPVFFEVRSLAFGAVAASMMAYMAAQFCDVQLFHFWKRLTNGKHLWLRNNASTMTSQIVDTTAVILITHFYANALPVNGDEPIWPQLITFILSGYVFKLLVAALDTAPLYWLVGRLRPYLGLDEHDEVPYGDAAAA